MDTKKENILEAAASLFLEQGFQRTSTQDIAETCMVSKATIYKYFSSKEELGLEVVFYLTERLLYQIEEYRLQSDLTAVEKLKESIIYRMRRFGERTCFVDVLLFSFTAEQRKLYFSAINKTKFQIFYRFSQLMTDAFSLDNQVEAWELTLNLNGLVRELTFIETDAGEEMDVGNIADFIIDSLKAISTARKGRKTVLTESQIRRLSEYFNSGSGIYCSYPQRSHIFSELREQAEAFPSPDRENIFEALALLEQEYRKKNSKPIMIEALIAYLESKPGLKKNAVLLRQVEVE